MRVDLSLDSALVWFRRDLRTHDHAALYHALRAARHVWCVYVVDTDALGAQEPSDRRLEFVLASLPEVDRGLATLGASSGVAGTGLILRHGAAGAEVPSLAAALHVQAVYTQHEDDPGAQRCDAQVRGALSNLGIVLHTVKDHLVFERDELLTPAGTPFTAFAPYRAAWLARLTDFDLKAYPVERHGAHLAPVSPELRQAVPALQTLGFSPAAEHLRLPAATAGGQAMLTEFLAHRLDLYRDRYDFPALKGPSYLGVHVRHGTLSVRELARQAWARAQGGSRGAQLWLGGFIWRDFFHQVLYHHPRVVEHAFRSELGGLKWEHGKQAEARFAAWCEGRTGYPLVDAAMLQLAHSGYMHQRLRKVAATFLVKHLGIDWRRGAAFFARHLVDHDLAINNGGWQWAASTGCEALSVSRVLNPVSQSQRFDAQGRFIARYLPQLASLPLPLLHAPWRARPIDLASAGIELGKAYPAPIVEHTSAREQSLQRYRTALGAAG